MDSIQNKLDAEAQQDIGRCQERERELQLAFIEGVGENPFMDNLNKIFKRKYKPQGLRKEQDAAVKWLRKVEDDLHQQAA